MVRLATEADVEEIAAIVHEAAGERIWIAASPDATCDDIRARVAEDLRSPKTFLVAERTGVIVGVLSLELRGGRCDLFMVVRADVRGSGVGTELVARAIEWAAENQSHKLSLEVWPHNAAAIALYRKFGFVEEGVRRRHYRRNGSELWDAVLMGLVLDESSPGSPHDT